jgi:hypothetical protein
VGIFLLTINQVKSFVFCGIFQFQKFLRHPKMLFFQTVFVIEEYNFLTEMWHKLSPPSHKN